MWRATTASHAASASSAAFPQTGAGLDIGCARRLDLRRDERRQDSEQYRASILKRYNNNMSIDLHRDQ